MTRPTPPFPTGRWLLAVLLILMAPASVPAQDALPSAADLAERREQLEQVWASALASEVADPLQQLQVWGVVIQSEVMLDRMQAVAAGSVDGWDSEAVVARVLDRWRELRPDAGGPELFRAFQIRDPTEQRRAVVALLDRYPDDPLVVSQAAMRLRDGGDPGRATEVLEELRIRHPDLPLAYRLLVDHYGTLGNETRKAELLFEWAAAFPADAALVQRWMRSQLPLRDAAETTRVLDRFFAERPAGATALDVCRDLARRGDPPVMQAARACLLQLTGDPELAERAVAALIEATATDGEVSALSFTLAELPPESRQRATIDAARALPAPDRCSGRIELLANLTSEMSWDDRSPSQVAHALKPCAERPEARELFIELVGRVPADGISGVVNAWATKINDRWRGELPSAAVAPILESRLQRESALELFEALDVTYQLGDPGGRRPALLRGWLEAYPDSFRGEQAIALAGALAVGGDPDGGAAMLEQQLERRFERRVAEELWGYYLETGGEERAAAFGADLLARADPWHTSAGNLLSARSAQLAGDPAAAERHYWRALDGEYPDPKVAAELLALIDLGGDASRVAATARRICEETSMSQVRPDPTRCATELVARVDSGEAAAELLAVRARELPNDLPTLRKLAGLARSAGQPEVAEQALRRLVELDPQNADDWVSLGVFLEKQGRLAELEDLLARARSQFSLPPTFLLRATARACLEAGEPRRAIDLLREARDNLPPGWDPAWIDAELRQAFTALGREVP